MAATKFHYDADGITRLLVRDAKEKARDDTGGYDAVRWQVDVPSRSVTCVIMIGGTALEREEFLREDPTKITSGIKKVNL